MTTPTPAASITLANGCVVRVGDVLPMKGGDAWFKVVTIFERDLRLSNNRLYDLDGSCITHMLTDRGIDLAKLAEQQAATAQPAGAPVDLSTDELVDLAKTNPEEAIKAAYKRGWDDREDDLILGVRRILPPAGATVRELVERIANDIVREVAELPGLTSPDTQPTALYVTEVELHEIIVGTLDECAAELAAALPGGMTEEAEFERAKKAYADFVDDVDDYQPWTGNTHEEALRAALRAAGLLGGKDG